MRTVYAAFGGQKPILGAICDEWLAESDVGGLGAQVMGEADDRRRLALVARLNRCQWELGQDVVPMLQTAAAADAEVAACLPAGRGSGPRCSGKPSARLAPGCGPASTQSELLRWFVP